MILHVLRALRERGLGFLVMYFINAIWFDIKNGTSTAFRRDKSSQIVSDPAFEDGLLYVASLDFVISETVAMAIDQMPSLPSDLSFIDVGCGKGKTILYAEKNFSAKFTNFIGIEYDERLVATARKNARKMNSSQTYVWEQSGEKLRSHLEQVSIVYFYNSFQGSTFSKTFLSVADKDFLLIYVDPVLHLELLGMGYENLASRQGRYRADTWRIYSSPGHQKLKGALD